MSKGAKNKPQKEIQVLNATVEISNQDGELRQHYFFGNTQFCMLLLVVARKGKDYLSKHLLFVF